MREKIFLVTLITFLFSSITVFAGDPPHNTASDVGCSDCHGMTLLNSHSPFWTDNTDDAAYSALCLRCHTLGNVDPYNATNAPPVKTHESIKCTICHHNHSQDQIYSGKNNRDYFFLAQGTATGISYDPGSDTTTITYLSLTSTDDTSSKWDDLSELIRKTDEGRGALLIPNTGSRKRWPLFMIVSIDDPEIVVKGYVSGASKIAIIYGQLIRTNVLYEPVHTTSRTVKLYDQEGPYSLAHNDEAVDVEPDGTMDDSTPTGMCQVCHTETKHWRNDGTRSENHYSGQYCIRCHPHTGSFLHGGGSGTGCDDCHGHDAGYDGKEGGAGTFETHSTHTENDDTHEKKGPSPVLVCADCHNINNFPDFADGVSYEDYKSGTMTTVCDNCHSPGGTYPHNNDLTDADVGAMANWQDGIYETDGVSLKPGKEKWCATCHDEEPANSKKDDSGVDAPNVIGDEDGSYTYGTGWGYYQTGHGLPATESYPASGGISPGVAAGCNDCHDSATAHIDGAARTFDDGESSSTDPSVYRTGYRLKLIDGEEPMVIPKTGRAEASNSRLCFSCHTDSSPYTTNSLGGTNFQDGINRHYYHMDLNDGLRFKADWGGDDYASQAYTSRITCISCHNVHGSTRLAMLRDGKLIDRKDGIEAWYYNPAISVDMSPPQPEDLPLTASTGLTWMPSTAGKVCLGCHGGTTRELFNRGDPYQDTTMAPVLEWSGETGFANDGVTPDSAASGTEFTFRVKYTDTNNDAPLVVELRVDADDNGSYESQYSMSGINDGDTTYVNGKIYSTTVTLSGNPGDVINYLFYAIEDKGTDPLEATGEPTGNSSITLINPTGNNQPELNWVTDTCRVDGVSPAAEVSGSNFTFYVEYTDADDECPAAASDIQVIVNGVAYDLNEVNGADSTCDDGKEYSRTVILNTPGDLTYRFTATDGSDSATGEPTADHTVTVIDATGDVLTVCPAGHAQAPCDHQTIQEAVDALDGAHTVVVYPDTYEEKVFFANDIDNDTLVRSACGPEETIIDVSSIADIYGVQVQNSTGSILDGFGITGGTVGVYLSVNPSFKHSNITLDNCNIYGNTNSSGNGGGIFITSDNGNSTITINDSKIYSNTAGTGAGIYLNRGVNSINNSEIYNNTATGSGGGARLGGTAVISRTTFRDNKANGDGGGIFVYGGVSMYQSAIIDNTADFDDSGFGNGGGITFPDGRSGISLYLENSVMAGNQAINGGGIWIDNGPFTAVNCTIADNQASGTGGAIHNNIPAQSYIKNSILWNNTASASGGHIASITSTTTMTISDSIINNDGGTTFDKYPYFVGDHSPSISGFISGADPFFEDAPNRDYHIKSYSPAIGNANAADAPASDIDDDSRPQGTADDIGADEYTP